MPTPFDQLDYLYTPSRDVAADTRWFTDVLGGTLEFAIESMGTRVALVRLTDGPPAVVLTEHLEGDRPVLVYRVADLDAAVAELEARGWARGHGLEIPQGPVQSFTAPGGHRVALYQLTRPGVIETFAGRRDF
jgi:glyoxalase/bleomycin resistance protein/dioxygenase superfamily protein